VQRTRTQIEAEIRRVRKTLRELEALHEEALWGHLLFLHQLLADLQRERRGILEQEKGDTSCGTR
jgi:hypothetical protein